MKKFTLACCLWAILAIGVTNVYGQAACPPNNISTDPANPQPASPPVGKEYKKNTFDWKQEFLNASNSTYYTTNSPLTNFFNNEVNNPNYQQVAKGTLSDYYPEDGWELIKRDFGKLASGGDNPVKSEGPYLVLYNKYSGILRIVAAFPGLGAQQAINVTISFKAKDPTNSNQSNLEFSALFNTYNGIAQAMDQSTVVNKVTTPAVCPGSDKRFFYADFQTSYDPCTCLFESALLVEFSTINTFTAQLSGRLLGVSESIATYSGSTYSLDKNQDYLTSIYRTDAATNNAQSGMLMYNTIQKMVTDYKANANSNTTNESFLSDVLDGFGDMLSVGGAIIGIAGGEIPKTLSAVGSLTKFFSSKIKAPGSTTPPPLPSVIHGEMSITGTITDQRLVGSSYFNFANPGSKKSNDKPEYNDGVIVSPPDVDYPIYNEVLGSFALMETPKLKYGIHIDDFCSDDTGPSAYSTVYLYQLSDDLKYVFNPKANINESSSRVSAALEIEATNNGYFWCSGYADSINMRATYNDGVTKRFLSPFMELKYFKNLRAGVMLSGNNWSLSAVHIKVMVEMVSNNPDRSGNPNQAVTIMTYDVPLSSITSVPLSSLTGTGSNDYFYADFSYAYTSPLNFTSNTVLTYWDHVDINSAFTTSPGVTVTVHSPEVNINPGGSIGPGIILDPTPLVSAGTPVFAQSSSYVSSFCDKTNPAFLYKGNTPTASTVSAPKMSYGSTVNTLPPTAGSTNSSYLYDVYPNPSIGSATIKFQLRKASTVSLYISDLTGRKVKVLLSGVMEDTGIHTIAVSTDGLSAGMYFYTLETSSGYTQTKQIIIIR